MIRKITYGDISDKEFEKVLRKLLDDYICSYIMPIIIAYYIANFYYRYSMYEGTFIQYYNFSRDLLNLFVKITNK